MLVRASDATAAAAAMAAAARIMQFLPATEEILRFTDEQPTDAFPTHAIMSLVPQKHEMNSRSSLSMRWATLKSETTI